MSLALALGMGLPVATIILPYLPLVAVNTAAVLGLSLPLGFVLFMATSAIYGAAFAFKQIINGRKV